MKHLFKLTFLVVCLLTGANSFAQNLKFGHIDSQKLLSIMPEKVAAQKTIQDKALGFKSNIKQLQEEEQSLIATYVKVQETLSDSERTLKEKEIQDLRNRMQGFDSYAQQELQKAQNVLLKPIFDKATKAIKEVGEEKGFVYIFDVSSGVILYNSTNSVDVMPLVKAKLGIK